MQKEKNNIINLGCRLNIFEGEIIKTLSMQNKLSDCTIINSCAVTKNAEKKVYYEIRKAKKKFPHRKIIITGCAAQINPAKYASLNEVDYVIGNKEKVESKTWSSLNNLNKINVDNIFLNKKTNYHLIEKFEGRARAYVEIQQGCNHRCTFCIIPFGRGNNRSIPIGIIVDRINLLINNGYKEVVLTGVDITDYGKDLPGSPNLSQLIKRIFNLIPKLRQLRLSSIDCAEITDDFWHVLEDPRLLPYFHLSLQSGNDLILKRMKRRHTHKQAVSFCNKVKKIRKDVVFGADIIAGFPTETENMFFDSISLIKKCDLTHLHIFPYSPRESTPAAKMPQLPIDIIKDRAKKLRNIGEKNLSRYLKSQIGGKARMLVEQSNTEGSLGKTQHFAKVYIKQKISEGSIVDCKIQNVNKDTLQAVLI